MDRGTPPFGFGTGLSLARRVRSNIGEISGGDFTARSLDRRELLLISCLTHGGHPSSVTDVSGPDNLSTGRSGGI